MFCLRLKFIQSLIFRATGDLGGLHEAGMAAAVQPSSPLPTQPTEEAHVQAPAATENASGRKCPMCETTFGAQLSEEAFEAHVVEHFG